MLKIRTTLYERHMPKLYQHLQAWDQIAQPIQLVHQSKGLDDSHSKELAQDLRGLAITMANEFHMHVEAKQITEMISEIFKELPQFADKFSEDLVALENIMERKAIDAEEERIKRIELSLDIEIGSVFKKRLIFTPEFIRYCGETIIANEVTRVRWGIFVQVTNGIRNSSYAIWIGTPTQLFEIECNTTFDSTATVAKRYEVILDKLWKLVCSRLFIETLRRLSSGEKNHFGEIIVDKDGIQLRKHKFIASEPFYVRWENLNIGNGPGFFRIASQNDNKVYAELSYRAIDNVHILESVMRFLWKDGNYQKLRTGEFK